MRIGDWSSDVCSSDLAHILRDLLVSIYPALPAQLPDERVDYWQGARPSMPDGLPCIGTATASADNVHAYGHGHDAAVSAARHGEQLGRAAPRGRVCRAVYMSVGAGASKKKQHK